MSEITTTESGSRFVGILLGAGFILLGVLFVIGRLAGVVFDFDIGHYGWPFFIIIPGLLMFIASFAAERRAGLSLAILGSMVTMTGAILLFQNTFDLYASWAYAWALVAPTSVGIAQIVHGASHGLSEELQNGLRLTGIGLAIFACAAVFFELVIGVSGFHLAGLWMFWPLLLIALGVIVLLSNVLPRGNQPSE